MKFRQDDLYFTVSALEEMYSDGFRYVCYPKDRSIYTGNEIHGFFDRMEAGEHALANGDWHSEPIQPFLDHLRLALAREKLPDVLETGYYYHLREPMSLKEILSVEDGFEKDIRQVFSELKTLGLYEPFMEGMVRDIVRYGDGPDPMVFREFDGRKVQFEPYIHYVHKTELLGYKVAVPGKNHGLELIYFPKQLPIAVAAAFAGDVVLLRMLSKKTFEAFPHGSTEKINNSVLLETYSMNRMNLENLQGEMRELKFSEKLIEQMEKEMAKGQPGFQLHTQLPADKGQIDVTLNFKQSGSSDYYFLNRYDLAMSKAKPLEEGKRYFVISPNPEIKNEHLSKKFDSAVLAMDYFKAQKGTAELAVGKTAADKLTLATMDKGTVDYVQKDFRAVYYSPAVTNSAFVDKGRGFNVDQAANMLQGRAVYRDDLVNRGTGELYKAWNVAQFDEPKDRYGNYKIKQYGENYGNDVIKELSNYNIKELGDPKKEAVLIELLKDGHRPIVTVSGTDGAEQKLRIEAMPRYGNYNFYKLDGKLEKREQFLKSLEQVQEKGQQKILRKSWIRTSLSSKACQYS